MSTRPMIRSLTPESSGTIKIAPETVVLCVHRGRRSLDDEGLPIPLNPRRVPAGFASGDFSEGGYVGDLVDTYDSQHYVVPVGYFTVPYGAALHFKTRAVVPGSRNPETGFQASFITILGVPGTPPFDERGRPNILKAVDDEAEWDPFTDDECREYDHCVEALDRVGMVDPIEKDVAIQSVSGGGNAGVIPASRVRGASNAQGRGGKKRTSIVGNGEAALRKRNAPGQNDATRAIAQGRAEQGAETTTAAADA